MHGQGRPGPLLQKPFPGQEINPFHPLADCLAGFWAHNEGAGLVTNAAGGGPRLVAANYATQPWSEPVLGGPSILVPAVVVRRWTGSTPYVPPPFTLFSLFRSANAGTQGVLVSHDAGINNGYRLQLVSGQLNLVFGAVAAYVFTGLSVAANTWYLAAATVNANGGTGTGYLSPLSPLSILTGTASVGTVSSATTPNSIGIANVATTVSQYVGNIGATGWWRRVLSPAEIAALFADPFGMFLPLRVTTSQTAAASAFQAAWARGSNRLIGGAVMTGG